MRLNSHEDVMDLLGESVANCGILLTEEDLGENFFDLSNGFAGELFQKFTTYRQKLALLVADLTKYSDRIQELAYEHNTHPYVRFVSTRQEAQAWLQSHIEDLT